MIDSINGEEAQIQDMDDNDNESFYITLKDNGSTTAKMNRVAPTITMIDGVHCQRQWIEWQRSPNK